MCRHVAYLGPPIALDALLFGTPTALIGQSRTPRFQPGIDDNPHGYGIGWFDADEVLHRHRSTTAIWDDPDLPALVSTTHSGAIVAAARLASPGLPVEISGNAPFTDGTWLFSLNGIVRGWHEGLGRELRSLVSPERAAAIEGHSDSEVLFAIALDRLDAGDGPGEALAAIVGLVAPRSTGELNMILANGRHLAATVWGHSLHVRDDHARQDHARQDHARQDHARHDHGLMLASEPFDDTGWERLPDRTLVRGDANGCSHVPLSIGVR